MENTYSNKNVKVFSLIVSLMLLACLLVGFFGYSSTANAADFNIYDSWHLSSTKGLNSTVLYKNILSKTGINVMTKSSDDIVVAIIDSGLDYENPYFENALWKNDAEINGAPGIDDDDNGVIDDYSGAWFSINEKENNIGSSNYSDCMSGGNVGNYWHGTHVAGIIHTIAPNVKIMPIRAGSKTDDKCYFNSADVIISILYAGDNGADIINLSLGTDKISFVNEKCRFTYNNKLINMSMQDAIDYVVNEKNVMVVAAAGNNGVETKFYPASCDNVISVMASNKDGVRWSKSNYSKDFDIMAPGVEIISTIGKNIKSNAYNLPVGYGLKSGTSMAAPYVSGVAALLMSCSDIKTGKEMAKYLLNKDFLSYAKISDGIGFKNIMLDYNAISKLLDAVIEGKTTVPPIEASLITYMTVFDNKNISLSIPKDYSGEVYWYINGKFKTVGPKCAFKPTEDVIVEARINNELVKVYNITVNSFNAYVGKIVGGVGFGLIGITALTILIYYLVKKKKLSK